MVEETEVLRSRGVCYYGRSIPVLPGDHVEIRGTVLFFARKRGVVKYVPGISEFNPVMEFNGLAEVGVDFEDGTKTATLVIPETGCLKKTVYFLARGDTPSSEFQISGDDEC